MQVDSGRKAPCAENAIAVNESVPCLPWLSRCDLATRDCSSSPNLRNDGIWKYLEGARFRQQRAINDFLTPAVNNRNHLDADLSQRTRNAVALVAIRGNHDALAAGNPIAVGVSLCRTR